MKESIMGRRPIYNLQSRYEELLSGNELYVSSKEASSIYQFVNNNGGKIQCRHSETGCYVKLLQPITGLKRQKQDISVEKLIEILKESHGRVAVSISISIR